MAPLRYRIEGSGIRGFSSTKDVWEVKKNEVMNVKLEGGCLSVYTKQNVRAGSIPHELQGVLRSFMSSKTSSVSIEVKVTSVKPVSRVKNKGQEILCDIELIGDDVIPVRNAILAVDEDINKLKKQQPELSFNKILSNSKNSSDNNTKRKQTLDNNSLTDGSGTKRRKTEASTSAAQKKQLTKSKNSSNNNKKRKQTLDNNSLTDGSGTKRRKTEGSTSATQTKLGATYKQIKKIKKQGKEMPSNSKNSSNNNTKRKQTLDNNSLTDGSGTKRRKTEGSTSATQTKLGATDKKKFTFRYQYLLIEIGAEVLRMLFNQLVNNDFMQYLNANLSEYNQLKFLMNKHIITNSQQQLLPPIDKKPLSSKFDITLLACLLKNVCGLRQQTDPVWDSDDPTDLSVEADITRLRKCRNNLAHSATVFISETDLTSKWNELSVILNRLGNKNGNANLLSKISAVHDMDIDEERKDHYDETLKLWDEMDQLFDHGVGKVMQKLDSIENVQAKMKEDVSEIKKHLKKNDTVNQRRNQLCREDCHKLSEYIGSNWKFLALELGITQVQIEHIMEDSRKIRDQIYQMLRRWVDKQGQHATTDKFITAMETCRDVTFDKDAIYLCFEELKKTHP